MKISKNILVSVIIGFAIVLWMMTGVMFNEPHKPISVKSKLDVQIKTEILTANKYNPIVNISGKINSDKSLIIKSQVNGVIDKIFIESNQKVKKKNLTIVISGLPAKSKLNEAKSEYESAKLDFNTNKKLYEAKLLSKSGYQKAKSNLNIAKSNLENAKNTYKKHYLTVPFDAIIGIVRVKVGQNISVGQDLYDLYNNSNYTFEGYVSSSQRKKINVNLSFSGQTSSNMPINGTLTAISSTPDNKTNTYLIKGKIEKNNFLIGESANIEIKLNPIKAHKISPSLLTINNDGDLSIRTVENGIIVLKPIEILNETIDEMWVYGLNEKTILITDGAGFAIEGEPIK